MELTDLEQSDDDDASELNKNPSKASALEQ